MNEQLQRKIGFENEHFVVQFEYNSVLINQIKLIESGAYDADNKRWIIPANNKSALKSLELFALANSFTFSEAATQAIRNPPGQKLTGLKCDYIDIANAMTSPPPAIDFVWPGLIAGTVGSIVAAGATGKGFLAMACGFSIASQIPLCGGVFDAPKKGRAVLFCGEDKAIELQRRIHAFGAWLHTQYSRDRVAEIIADCKKDQKLSISSEHGNSVQLMDDRGQVSEPVKQSLLKAADGSRLIIIDTFRRFYGGDENSSGQVNDFLCTLEEISETTGSTILFTHHANKGAVLNGQTDVAGAARGSSVLTDNIRWQLNLATMTEAEAPDYDINPAFRKDFVKVVLPKANYVANQNGTTWVVRKKGGVLEHVELSKPNKPQKGDLRTVQGGRK